MLLSIDIRNFAIIKSLQLDWQAGMTVITGETGAGKSIVIDALGLALGGRADPGVITANCQQAEISAVFKLSSGSTAHQWLFENNLIEDDDIQLDHCECILRRVIVKEGRSKCYINGRNSTQSQLKELASSLVDIHGQHAQQSLLKNKEQLNLLDRYANHSDLLDNVKLAFQQLKTLENRKQLLNEQKLARDAKRELLTYQVEELILANPEQAVLDNLENKHRQAANSQDRLELSSQALLSLSEDETHSSLIQLNQCIAQLNQLTILDPSLNNLVETLGDAESLLQDASAELIDYSAHLTCDPEELNKLDQQLSQFHDLARKHHVTLADLPSHFLQLQTELNQLQADDDELDQIQQQYDQSFLLYKQQANLLTESRTKTAKQLEKLVTDKLQPLAMEGGKFSIQLNKKTASFFKDGMEEIEFQVSANPGQPLQALNKVASGGELSRISLAISVITSEQQLFPTIIFDEVDVGIGGATAETVGILLKQLARNRQVLCVTHQPQVACCGHQHLIAAKTKNDKTTSTSVQPLNQQQRIDEIARMLGGKVISQTTLSHANEMLNMS